MLQHYQSSNTQLFISLYFLVSFAIVGKYIVVVRASHPFFTSTVWNSPGVCSFKIKADDVNKCDLHELPWTAKFAKTMIKEDILPSMSAGVLRTVGRNIMKAIRVSEFGAPEVMKVETNVPVPKPAENQVLIKVHSAGINPVDTYIRAGTYARKPALPYTPGSDVGGVVEDVGQGVTKFKKGDRVFTIRTESGGYAEYTVAEVSLMGHLGDNLSLQQGGGMGVPYYTAYRALVLKANIREGETVLIHGASGAVGLACVQIAKSRGAKVIGTAGSKEGQDLILKMGGDASFNHREDNYTEKIMEACNGTGPNVIIEMLSNVNLQKDLEMAASRGRIIIVGSRGNIEISPRLTMGKELTVQGVMLFLSTAEEWEEMHAGIQAEIKAGTINPHIGKMYTLDQAPQAHKDIVETKAAQGKLIITL